MNDFIQRSVYFELENHLSKKEISIILGPRQSGKTTIIKRLQEDQENQGQSTLFINLDVIEDLEFFQSQHALLDYIEKKVGRQKAFIFIDEISRLENAGLFLKGLYDLNTNYKFIVTGSGSLELKSNIIEPLTGRKRIFYCLPLSFSEFTVYKRSLTANGSRDLLQLAIKELTTQPLARKRLINEYLSFGGYPRVVTSESEEEKKQVLEEIFTSYLEKDIKLLLNVEKEHIFGNLVRVLATQSGNLINRSELSSTLGVTEKTIEKYLHLLEKTFVISLIRPFFENARKELTKSPKVYFNDLGFLHIAQGIAPRIEMDIKGNEFENACFLRLKELPWLIDEIRFWRTKSKAEVDFVVISSETGKPIPIEVKTSTKGVLGKSLISFIDKYKPEEGFIIYSNTGPGQDPQKHANTHVHFIPYHVLPNVAIDLPK